MKEKGTKSMATDITRDFEYTERPRHSPGWQLAIDIGETILLTVVMFLIIRLAVQDFQVEGTSMLPTVQNGQFVLVDKLTYDFATPKRGDIIVFEYPRDHTQNYIKRVIGLPGDRIFVSSGGDISVNGYQLTEPYTNNNDNPYGEESRIVGPHQFFVLGDNRGYSSDSRDWGLVDQHEIIGKATLVYWPFSAIHLLPDGHAPFQHVPTANPSLPAPTTTLPSHIKADAGSGPLSSALLICIVPCAGSVVATHRPRR